jgi:hypothetical protein
MKPYDVNGNLRDSAKQFTALYIDSSQKIGQAMLELHERSTTWAKETPLEALFDAQRSAGKQILENSIALVRKVWGAIDNQDELVTRS